MFLLLGDDIVNLIKVLSKLFGEVFLFNLFYRRESEESSRNRW